MIHSWYNLTKRIETAKLLPQCILQDANSKAVRRVFAQRGHSHPTGKQVRLLLGGGHQTDSLHFAVTTSPPNTNLSLCASITTLIFGTPAGRATLEPNCPKFVFPFAFK